MPNPLINLFLSSVAINVVFFCKMFQRCTRVLTIKHERLDYQASNVYISFGVRMLNSFKRKQGICSISIFFVSIFLLWLRGCTP